MHSGPLPFPAFSGAIGFAPCKCLTARKDFARCETVEASGMHVATSGSRV